MNFLSFQQKAVTCDEVLKLQKESKDSSRDCFNDSFKDFIECLRDSKGFYRILKDSKGS